MTANASETPPKKPGYRPLTIFGDVCQGCGESVLLVSYANGERIKFDLWPWFSAEGDAVMASHQCRPGQVATVEIVTEGGVN